MRTRAQLLASLVVLVAAPGARADAMFPDEYTDRAAPRAEATSVAAPAKAPDPPSPALGEPGEIVVSGSALGSIATTSYEGSEARRTYVGFGPGLDLFVARRFSVGLDLDLARVASRGYGADSSLVDLTTTTLSAGGRLGWLVPLGGVASLWPRLTLGVEHVRRTESLVRGGSLSVPASPIGATSTTYAGPWFELYLPLLVSIEPRWFLGFGPRLRHDLAHAVATSAASSASAQPTSIGAALIVGGFFGGPDVAATEVEPPPDTKLVRARFGDVGALVITNEMAAAASRTSYSGTGSSNAAFGLDLGLDYFVEDHFSVGAALVAGYARSSGVQPDGASVDGHTSSIGFAPRLGLELPITPSVSIWPRVGIVIAGAHQSEKSGTATNAYDLETTTLSVSAPVLVHVSPRFFVGVGPTFSRDLSGKVGQSGDLRATSFGLGGILGGWT